MNDIIKHKPYSITSKEDSVELLKYKLESSHKETRKSILIAALIVGIIAFASGFIFRDFDRSEVNALRNSNLELREEIQELKAQTPSENQ